MTKPIHFVLPPKLKHLPEHPILPETPNIYHWLRIETLLIPRRNPHHSI
jgi:hypothetical protein